MILYFFVFVLWFCTAVAHQYATSWYCRRDSKIFVFCNDLVMTLTLQSFGMQKGTHPLMTGGKQGWSYCLTSCPSSSMFGVDFWGCIFNLKDVIVNFCTSWESLVSRGAWDICPKVSPKISLFRKLTILYLSMFRPSTPAHWWIGLEGALLGQRKFLD